MSEIVVTGMGIVSALGMGVQANLLALKSQQSGIRHAKNFQSAYASTMVFGEVTASNDVLKKLRSDLPPNITRTTLLALHAFQEAIEQANLSDAELTSARTAFISASTVGGMCETDALYHDANATENPTPYKSAYEGSNHVFEIVQLYGLTGYTDTINTACSSAANAIMLGARLLETKKADRVIVGGVDCLAKFTVNGFNSLRILSEKPCKPFDANREGLNLGEAAAYLILERNESVASKKPIARVSGYGNANDAFHPSATSDEAFGPISAMMQALKKANLKPEEIHCVNAHGTGTPNNDITESFALSQVFGTPPPYSSTKSYTGHTLAAAGSVEAIYSILSIQEQLVFPSLHIDMPIADFTFKPTQKLLSTPIVHVLSNSFGFGGNCTSLIFSACS